MWLTDHLMNMHLSQLFGKHFARLPFMDTATIICGNALRIDWGDVVSMKELTHIFGNPPFLGYSMQSKEQKSDILSIYVDRAGKPIRGSGKIDYVAAWYFKAAQCIAGTRIRAAFVSTNSITQGEQVATVWKPLFELFGIHIDFGYRTFRWSNEAKGQAAVYCVIVGFSTVSTTIRTIFDGATRIAARNVTPYLVDTNTVFIRTRTKPLCDVPVMMSGNRATDGGHLIIEQADYDAFVAADPLSKSYIRRFMMGQEFINDKIRYCLWLVGVAPSDLRKMPEVLKRVAACRDSRRNSPDHERRRLANSPTLFREQLSPDQYLAIPKVSSEKRAYIPIGFMDNRTIPGDKLFIIPDATRLLFGILTSSVHMAWMRAVGGRLGTGYSYSIGIVYNNFPWPKVTPAQTSVIEQCGQAVLDARALFPNSSLADLYDPLTMPPALQIAHHKLDRAVLKLYQIRKKDISESAIVAELMKRHIALSGS